MRKSDRKKMVQRGGNYFQILYLTPKPLTVYQNTSTPKSHVYSLVFLIHQSIKGTHMLQGSNERCMDENCMLISVIRCILQPQRRLMMDPIRLLVKVLVITKEYQRIQLKVFCRLIISYGCIWV